MERKDLSPNPKSSTGQLIISNTISISKSQNNIYANRPNRIPTFEEIIQLSGSIACSKKNSPESSPVPSMTKSQQEIKLPRIQLYNSQKGINKPYWFPENEETPQDTAVSRFTSRPVEILDSAKKIFPTLSLKFYQMPTTSAERFGEINANEDLHLANYAVSSNNAFRSEWNKFKGLKDRKFCPEKHPEFTALSKENNFKRDKLVDYREAMLKVKSMMTQAWEIKK